MNTLERESSSNNKAVKNSNILKLQMALLAALLVSPSVGLQSKESNRKTQDTFQGVVPEKNRTEGESVESINSYETLFKEGIRKTLTTVNSLNDIPVGGKKIEYYRVEGQQAGKKIDTEVVKKLGLPDKFDIFPKKITTPTNIIEITIGDRHFTICPDIGKFVEISMNQNNLQLRISALFVFTKQYDKQNKLPILLLQLWKTPKGPGVKIGFIGSEIKEIIK